MTNRTENDQYSQQMIHALGEILEESLNEIYIFDATSLHFLLANKGARENSGYSFLELQVLTPLDMKPEFSLKSFNKLLEPLTNEKQDFIHFETLHKRKNGTLYPILAHMQRAVYRGQAAYASIVLDITATKNVERALQISEVKAQAVLDNAVEGIINIDSKGIILSFNKAAEKIFGYLGSETIGKNVNVLMPAPFHREHDAYIENYISTGNKKIIGIGREVRGLRRNGEEFPLDLSVAETIVGNQRIFTGIIRDITERKLIEQRLKQQSEETRKTHEQLAHISRLSTMGEMAAGIAHEINQPLTAIATYAQAAKRLLDINNVDDLAATLAKIDLQAHRAGEVIRRLRTIVSKQEINRMPTDINDLIKDTLDLLHSDIINNQVLVKLDLGNNCPVSEVDAIQIQQVIINLIRNSMDSMTEAGCAEKIITVASSIYNNDFIKVSVSDNGLGVKEKDINAIFNPFYTTKKLGMGMGLSISRSIIATHGGQLKYNPDYKQGAEFSFLLPVMPMNQE